MNGNRDAREPLTDAERARRYRARRRGEDVPRGEPGRPANPPPSHAERAREGAAVLYGALGWLAADGVAEDAVLGALLDLIAQQIARLRPGVTIGRRTVTPSPAGQDGPSEPIRWASDKGAARNVVGADVSGARPAPPSG